MSLLGITSAFRLAACVVYMAVLVLFFSCVLLLLLPSRTARIRVANVFGHLAGRGSLWLAGARIPPGLTEAARRTRPAIYVSNHTSLLDIFVGIWLAPWGTVGVAKKEVVYYPFFGQLYAISGHILLDRANRKNAVEALASAAETIRRHGLGVWIWPEGTRAKDGRLLPFKKGFAHLAIATRLPIVPVVVTGAHRAMEKHSLVIRPTDLGIRVLPAIPTDDWTLEGLDAHIETVRAAFVAALPEDQRPLSDAAPEAPLPAAAV